MTKKGSRRSGKPLIRRAIAATISTIDGPGVHRAAEHFVPTSPSSGLVGAGGTIALRARTLERHDVAAGRIVNLLEASRVQCKSSVEQPCLIVAFQCLGRASSDRHTTTRRGWAGAILNGWWSKLGACALLTSDNDPMSAARARGGVDPRAGDHIRLLGRADGMPHELILNFHGLGEPPRWVTDGEREVWVPVDWLEAIIDAPLSDGVRLTFDDGNASDVHQALPVLTERGIAGQFFPLTGRIGHAGYLGAEDIAGLSARAWESGATA